MVREIISNEDIMYSNMLSIEAIIAVLEKKGIAKREEFIKELNRIRAENAETIKKMGREN
ncbi:MAG: hypothetical protein P8X73_18560 [Ignavibacteriaceae bacterium]